MSAPVIYRPQPGDVELLDKVQKLKALSDAIIKAKHELAKSPSYNAAAALQDLQRQRDALRRTLPLRLVSRDGVSVT